MQGLSGPRLLLQGLGGPSAWSFTPSGGMSLGGQAGAGAVSYHIYMNHGLGDPIDYEISVGAATGTTWTSGPLALPGVYRLAVRAFDASAGLEEANIDAAVELRLDPGGADVTGVPDPPLGLRAFPLAAGAVRVEWTAPVTDPRRKPLGFHIYLQPTVGSGPPALISTVAWSQGRLGWFSTSLAGLADGSSYSIGVGAYNAVGEDPDARVVIVQADANPPALVDDLAAVATNRQA
jgi:hypothetical protein